MVTLLHIPSWVCLPLHTLQEESRISNSHIYMSRPGNYFILYSIPGFLGNAESKWNP